MLLVIILTTRVKWITFSHWRLLNTAYEQLQYEDIHEFFYAFVVDKKMYFFISVCLKLLNHMGRNYWNLCFTSFKIMLWLTHRKNNCIGAMVVTATGSWCLPRPCSIGQGTLLVLPSHPLVAGLWVFRQCLPTIQPFPTFFRANVTRHILWFYSLKLFASYCQGSCSIAGEPYCRVALLWFHDGDDKFKPKTGNSICLKDQQLSKLEPYGWCLYPCLLCWKSRHNT